MAVLAVAVVVGLLLRDAARPPDVADAGGGLISVERLRDEVRPDREQPKRADGGRGACLEIVSIDADGQPSPGRSFEVFPDGLRTDGDAPFAITTDAAGKACVDVGLLGGVVRPGRWEPARPPHFRAGSAGERLVWVFEAMTTCPVTISLVESDGTPYAGTVHGVGLGYLDGPGPHGPFDLPCEAAVLLEEQASGRRRLSFRNEGGHAIQRFARPAYAAEVLFEDEGGDVVPGLRVFRGVQIDEQIWRLEDTRPLTELHAFAPGYLRVDGWLDLREADRVVVEAGREVRVSCTEDDLVADCPSKQLACRGRTRDERVRGACEAGNPVVCVCPEDWEVTLARFAEDPTGGQSMEGLVHGCERVGPSEARCALDRLGNALEVTWEAASPVERASVSIAGVGTTDGFGGRVRVEPLPDGAFEVLVWGEGWWTSEPVALEGGAERTLSLPSAATSALQRLALPCPAVSALVMLGPTLVRVAAVEDDVVRLPGVQGLSLVIDCADGYRTRLEP